MIGVSFVSSFVDAARTVIPQLVALAALFGAVVVAANAFDRWKNRTGRHPSGSVRVVDVPTLRVRQTSRPAGTRHTATQGRSRPVDTSAVAAARDVLADHRAGHHDGPTWIDPVLGCQFPGCSAAYWLIERWEGNR